MRTITSSDTGLRVMMGTLSTLPVAEWWGSWTRPTAPQHAAPSPTWTPAPGSSPTCVRRRPPAPSTEPRCRTRSPARLCSRLRANDRGAPCAPPGDFLRPRPDARLVDTGADSHLFWLGAIRQTVLDAIRDFIAE